MALSTQITNTLKRIYPGPNGFTNAAVRGHVFASMVKKTPGFTGETAHRAIQYTNPTAVGPDFGTVQTNNALGATAQWTLTRKSLYGVIRLTGEDLMASKDAGAFVQALKRQTDSTMEAMGARIGVNLYKNKGGAIGKIATAGITGNVVTLTEAKDVLNFAPGMEIVASAADGTSGTFRNNAGTVYQADVASVDLDAGTVTFTAVADITGLAAADFLFPAQPYIATNVGLGFNGLDGWLPLTAPSSTTFNGVNRTLSMAELAGHRLDDTSGTHEEIIQELAGKVARTAAKGDARHLKYFMGPGQYSIFQRQLGSKVQYMDHGQAEIGFKGILIHTAVGSVEVLADSDCPETRGYLLNMNDWDVLTMGGFPHIIEDDGMAVQRVYNADSVELRVRAFGDLFCANPKNNGVNSFA